MTSADDPFLPLAFSLFSNPGAYAVLAGAGVSRGAGLPTAWDIVVDLVDQIAGADADIDSETASPWYEETFGRSPTYSDVVEQLALTPTERQALLEKYFEPSDEDGSPPGPSTAHRSVARLMQAGIIRVIVTMNFDRLFEQALRELGVEPTIIATESDARGTAPLHTLQQCVIHLHGDYKNPTSMRNTATELRGYGRHMGALLRRVLSDYGLLVAGWSAQHDHALREAVIAHHPHTFTMGWVEPGPLSDAADTLTRDKRAIALPATADEALGHLADQIEAMRTRKARHPLSLAVAASRIKREIAGQRAAIGAHDMLAAEFTRLRDNPAFHLANYSDTSGLPQLLDEVTEATQIPAGSVAALSYWGDTTTDRWWLDEIERFARPNRRASGAVSLLELPLIAAATLFYCAGAALTASQRYDALATMFDLRGMRSSLQPGPLSAILAAAFLADGAVAPASLHSHVAQLVGEAIGLGVEPVDDALQLFEVLRACWCALTVDNHQLLVETYTDLNDRLDNAPNEQVRLDTRTEQEQVVGRVADACPVYGTHIHAAERTYNQNEGRRWGCPTAERLADDIKRLGEKHLLPAAFGTSVDALWLGLKGVSTAVGRVAQKLEWQATPIGIASFVSDEFWLDTGKPPG